MRPLVVMLLTSACVVSLRTPIINPQVFRSRAVGVTVSVTVRNGAKIVTGLTSNDFELRDDGVPQNIVAAFAEALPLDITLALDTSYSLSDSQFARVMKATQQIVGHLRAADRLRLVTFDQRITEVLPLSTPTESKLAFVERGHTSDSGGSAVFDAIAFVLMASVDQ